jgi:EAL domain-containing protein (putative c-di-GMP-specific phosphodiesterase class I)
MDRRAHELLELEIDLRAAISDGSWHLAYQPVIELATNRVAGCEALLRWDHPERGAISPLRVVEIAETTGLIHPLGEHVLRRACAQGAAWSNGSIQLSMAVNASAHQLDSDDFPAIVRRAVAEAGHDASRVVVEITESALAARADELDVVERIRAEGCKIALDDFGTGYSSLARLRELPIDIIKIDRAFVTPIGESSSANATIEAIVAVGHALGLTIVAEGVETEQQAHLLRELGCDRAQGYLFGRPMVPADFERWYAAR